MYSSDWDWSKDSWGEDYYWNNDFTAGYSYYYDFSGDYSYESYYFYDYDLGIDCESSDGETWDCYDSW